MRKNKSGFTLAEVLICLTIAGLIVALSVNSLKIIKTSYTALAYFEMNYIRQIAGELIAGKAPTEEIAGQTCIFDPSTLKYIITPDDNTFCTSVASLLNVVGKTNCTNFAPVTNYNERNTDENKEKIINITNNTAGNYNFMTTNGHRYYISAHQSGADINSIFGYRTIGVDLNGKSAPNISQRDGDKMPDIISFVILDTGEVFPVGVVADNPEIPKYNRTVLYLNSKVKGYYYSHTEVTGEARNESSIPAECKIGNKQICDYAVVNVPNNNSDKKNSAVYSYREAYCSSLGAQNSTFGNYCQGLPGNPNCPPSSLDTQFDLCLVENIKPMFRYNFN